MVRGLRTQRLAVAALLIASGLLVLLPADFVAPTNALPGDRIASANMPTSQAGVGLAFDGELFWYAVSAVGGPLRGFSVQCGPERPATCATTVEHTVTVTDDDGQTIRIEAMEFDATRGLLWAAEYGTLDVFLIDPQTGQGAYQFTGGCASSPWPDGLAYDAEDDTIWFSPDNTQTICHHASDGTLLAQHSIYAIPGIPAGCTYQSGVGVGGPYLYLAFANCNVIVQVRKADFSDPLVITNPSAWHEDMTCDPVTFDDAQVIWTRSYYSQVMVAFEIPAGTCNVGGATTFHATADAFGMSLLGGPVPQDVAPTPQALVPLTTEPTAADGYAQQVDIGAAVATVAVVNATAGLDSDAAARAFAAHAHVTMGRFDWPGVLRFEALHVVSTTSIVEGELAGSAEGSRIMGLSLQDGPSVTIDGSGPLIIPLPDGSGTVELFGQQAYTVEGAASLRVVGVRVQRTFDEGPMELIVGHAYSGATFTGSLDEPVASRTDGAWTAAPVWQRPALGAKAETPLDPWASTGERERMSGLSLE